MLLSSLYLAAVALQSPVQMGLQAVTSMVQSTPIPAICLAPPLQRYAQNCTVYTARQILHEPVSRESAYARNQSACQEMTVLLSDAFRSQRDCSVALMQLEQLLGSSCEVVRALPLVMQPSQEQQSPSHPSAQSKASVEVSRCQTWCQSCAS